MKNLFNKKSNKKVESSDSGVTLQLSDAKINLWNLQHQGDRPYQEDSFGFSDFSKSITEKKGILAVLADGMGGLKNGKAVSETVVSSLLEWFNSEYSVCQSGSDLKNIIYEANHRICDIYCPDGSISSGSTIVAVLIYRNMMHWLSIGDSRLYLKRDGKLFQVNEDHDFLNQLLDDVIDESMEFETAYSNKQKDSLVGCIGKRDLTNFDYSKSGLRLLDGDIILICSDGVYNSVSLTELNGYLSPSVMASCENIGRHIAEKNIPGQDNYTAVVLSYQEKGVS